MSLEAVYWKVNKDNYIKYSIQLTGSAKKEFLAAAKQLADWELKLIKHDFKHNRDTKLMSKDFKDEQGWKNFTDTLSFPLQEITFKPVRVKKQLGDLIGSF